MDFAPDGYARQYGVGVLGLMLVVGFRAFRLEALGIVRFDVRFTHFPDFLQCAYYNVRNS